jgi:hypothetical protein
MTNTTTVKEYNAGYVPSDDQRKLIARVLSALDTLESYSTPLSDSSCLRQGISAKPEVQVRKLHFENLEPRIL